jgi:4a-hydroxytetrahydrobiopterin dehydratase
LARDDQRTATTNDVSPIPPRPPDERYPEGWNEVRGALQRGFRFGDFREAIAFVNRLADAAEEADHHPDIAISWNAVTVRWWTHTKRAITDRDVEMAGRTNELAGAPST